MTWKPVILWAVCYPAILGFIRLVTNRRVFSNPLSLEEAANYDADFGRFRMVKWVNPLWHHHPVSQPYAQHLEVLAGQEAGRRDVGDDAAQPREAQSQVGEYAV